MELPIYLDYAATTPMDPRVARVLSRHLSRDGVFGNPSSSTHAFGRAAAQAGSAFLLLDTAGRLHNRHNLMAELTKIRRTIARFDAGAPQDTLLVVDATTGSNALQQARAFHQSTPLTGLVVTKLDGSGKGGIAVAIHEELGIAPHFVGTGERPQDFSLFRREEFVQDLL